MKLIEEIESIKDKRGYKERRGKFLCPFCGKEVEKRLAAGLKAKSCGCKRKELISESHKGMKYSEEYKQKLSNIHKNLWVSGLEIGTTGKIYSIETRKKQSESHKGQNFSEIHKDSCKCAICRVKRGETFGENNPNWQGGKSFEIYPQEFNKELKDYIKQRDMYMCQTPGCMEINYLHIHHIDYNKQNNNPENFITLCRSCHMKTTNIKNKEYWIKYYYEIREMYL